MRPRTNGLIRVAVTFALIGGFVGLGHIGATSSFAASGITFEDLPGSQAPPPGLGGYAMQPFGPDTRPEFIHVTATEGPTGLLTFDGPVEHERIGSGWSTWSHGYRGDVYDPVAYDPDSGSVVTLGLPTGTRAFYFYAEPQAFGTFQLTARAQDGTSSGPITARGDSDARYFGFYTDGSVPLASITVTAPPEARGFAVGEFGISGGRTSSINLVGMGDSYSSGEANPPFLDSDGCNRSNQAYAPLMAAANSWTLRRFTACSGATTPDFMTVGPNGEQAQVLQLEDDIEQGKPVHAITLTLGGNDVGFASILKYCMFTNFSGASPDYVANYPPSPDHPTGCASDNNFANQTLAAAANEHGVVVDAFRRLAAIAGPNASVMAADYPQIFPPDESAQDCIELAFLLTEDDQNWFRALTNVVDDELRRAAAEAGVNFVEVRSAFAGHAICDGDQGDAWINAVTNVDGFFNFNGSFHPNASGHLGYARAFVDYINEQVVSGAPLTPVGLPANPAVSRIASRARVGTDAPTLTLGALSIAPPEYQLNCPSVVQGGEEVTITGAGFADAANLTVSLYAAGKNGRTQAIDLGAQTADHDGTFSTTVRLPLDLAGVTRSGTDLAVAYIQAAGPGATSSRHLDNELLNVASHGSRCGLVSPLPFQGFNAPVRNLPTINAANPGSMVPIKFAIPEVPGTIGDVLAPGYPQTAPVDCSTPTAPIHGTATSPHAASGGKASDQYHYDWATDRAWVGCRALIIKLADGSIHSALFNFGRLKP